jgi:penicillin-binding protein 1C
MHRYRKYAFRSGAAVFVLLATLWVLCPKPALYNTTSFSTAVYDRHARLLRLTLAADDCYRLFTPLDKIAPEAVEATLLYEDAYFYRHPGVNPIALLRAAWTTFITRQRTLGGSTITMQLARIRFGIDSHSLTGKCVQILRALQLERHYSKNEILEAYLNLAPYGGNVEGIGTASLVYFGKPASRLDRLEALTLVVIPQNPNARRPRPHAIPAELTAARLRAFELWSARHPEDQKLASRMALPLPMRTVEDLPFRAPHFVEALLNMHPKPGEIHASLDFDLQQQVERRVADYVARRSAQGIHNAAVLVIDTRDVSVRAWVGAADWFNNAIDGQVNGVLARRSPGSALKPFVYALALDQGLIHPMTLLKDVPKRFGAYTPENFDRGFMGPVFARDALIYSRNVPAVSLAARLSHPDFYHLLKRAGIGEMYAPDHYGAVMVLGTVEVTMAELGGLYAALADYGLHRPLALTLGEAASARAGKRLFSPEAAFITLDMLAQNPRPGAPFGEDRRAPVVAWKTGTSFAFRDAWSVGVSGPYVIVVWVGDFAGAGNPAFVGRRAAAPLLFELADAMAATQTAMLQPAWSPDGLNVRKVSVCAGSGDLPNRYCPQETETWFIPGVSPIKVTNVYRPVMIDNATGLRACPGSDRPAHPEVFEFWPSDILALFKLAGLPRRVPPAYMPGCALTDTALTGSPPNILTPQSTLVYRLRADRLDRERLPFTAVADADTRSLYWFVDGSYIGHSKPDETLFWKPKPGRFRVRVVDDLGRADSARLQVALLPEVR